MSIIDKLLSLDRDATPEIGAIPGRKTVQSRRSSEQVTEESVGAAPEVLDCSRLENNQAFQMPNRGFLTSAELRVPSRDPRREQERNQINCMARQADEAEANARKARKRRNLDGTREHFKRRPQAREMTPEDEEVEPAELSDNVATTVEPVEQPTVRLTEEELRRKEIKRMVRQAAEAEVDAEVCRMRRELDQIQEYWKPKPQNAPEMTPVEQWERSTQEVDAEVTPAEDLEPAVEAAEIGEHAATVVDQVRLTWEEEEEIVMMEMSQQVDEVEASARRIRRRQALEQWKRRMQEVDAEVARAEEVKPAVEASEMSEQVVEQVEPQNHTQKKTMAQQANNAEASSKKKRRKRGRNSNRRTQEIDGRQMYEDQVKKADM